MLEKRLLKSLLDHELFERNSTGVLKFLPRQLSSIGNTLKEAHERYGRDLTLDELYDLHIANNPALTVAQKNNLDILFGELYELEPTAPDVAVDIINKLYLREQARKVAQECIEVINGQADNFDAILSAVSSLSECGVNSTDLVPVTDDVDELIDRVDKGVKWFYNLKPLRDVAVGGGPGLFTIIAARPEAGKTLTHVSLSCAPDGFCQQGALVHGIVNEEPAERTKVRAVTACSGMDFSQIKESPEKAKEAWKAIKGRYYLFDGVGISASAIDAHVRKYKPDILIVDQLDKITVEGNFNRADERLREVYTAAREIAKKNSIWVIGISQLSAEAEGRANVDASMLEGSKTGKFAEGDSILCLGYNKELHSDHFRQINVPKNKISGCHESVSCKINPRISRLEV